MLRINNKDVDTLVREYKHFVNENSDELRKEYGDFIIDFKGAISIINWLKALDLLDEVSIKRFIEN